MTQSPDRELAAPTLTEGDAAFVEVARVWRRIDEEGEEIYAASTRSLSDDPEDWLPPLACLAATAAKTMMHDDGLPDFLHGPGSAVLAYGLLRDASLEFSEAVDAFAVLDGSEDPHPGLLLTPEPAEEREDARQVVSIWLVPAVECEGCGEVHPGALLAGVAQMPNLTAEDFGAFLAKAAEAGAAMLAKGNGGDPQALLMQIQAGFLNPTPEDAPAQPKH